MDWNIRDVHINFEFDMRVIEPHRMGRTDRNPFSIHDEIVLRLRRGSVVSQHHGVPCGGLGPRPGTGWLQIIPVSRVFPHLGEVSGMPTGLLEGDDLAEDYLGEEIRIIPAAQVDHALDSSITAER